MSRSKLEDELYEGMRLLSMSAEGFPMPVREYRPFWKCCQYPARDHAYGGRAFCVSCNGRPHELDHGRNWRCDFAWPELRLIVEVEGGVFTGGRHTRGAGYTKDLQKYNAIVNAGWNLQRFTGEQVRSGEALNVIRKVIAEMEEAA